MFVEIRLEAVLEDPEYKISKVRGCLDISINEMTARKFT